MELRENKFLLFKSPSLWYSNTGAPGNSDHVCPPTCTVLRLSAGPRCKHTEKEKTYSFSAGVWPGGCEDRGKDVLGSSRISGTLSLDEQGQEEKRGSQMERHQKAPWTGHPPPMVQARSLRVLLSPSSVSSIQLVRNPGHAGSLMSGNIPLLMGGVLSSLQWLLPQPLNQPACL